MTRNQMIAHLRPADAVARDAVAHGHHPFGAVLVGPDDAILMRQGNIDTVHHAETELARRAAAAYPPEFLWTCALVSTGEPCAMCTGTLYWANIGRLVRRAELRLAEVRTDVRVLATPCVPGSHALLEQCNVLVVRHRSIPVPIRIFSPMKVLCKDMIPHGKQLGSKDAIRRRWRGPAMIRGSFSTQLIARVLPRA